MNKLGQPTVPIEFACPTCNNDTMVKTIKNIGTKRVAWVMCSNCTYEASFIDFRKLIKIPIPTIACPTCSHITLVRTTSSKLYDTVMCNWEDCTPRYEVTMNEFRNSKTKIKDKDKDKDK